MLNSLLLILCLANCDNPDEHSPSSGNPTDILGYDVLAEINGHWVGSNQTSFGFYEWFAFDFRPISSSHVHSIYEGGSNQNIITSLFIADFEGKQQIMARNGGWLGNQYRATYFVLDKAEESNGSKYYRLVDAVGREDRAYMELRFENDTLYFDAYKDNGGALDEPLHHMGFKGTNFNPTYSEPSTELFDFPQPITEVNLENAFTNLIDSDSALFLEESADPFPKSNHGHLSDLTVNIEKANAIQEDNLLLYISKKPIVDTNGVVNFDNLNKAVVRTIDVQSFETAYISTYLHPDTYFITLFSDKDGNFYPSEGDFTNVSKEITVAPESVVEMEVSVDVKL